MARAEFLSIVGRSLVLRVVADLSKCQGYANCLMVDPERFDLDAQNQVTVLRESIGSEEEDTVEMAVRNCPTHALRVER